MPKHFPTSTQNVNYDETKENKGNNKKKANNCKNLEQFCEIL